MTRRLPLTLLALGLIPLAALVRAEAEPPSPPPPPLDPAQVLSAFAPGEGREQTAAACGACHSPVIITGKKLDEDGWAQVVDHMIDKGAQVTDANYDAIVTYLAAHYGPTKG